jgi:hypothetical protein
MLFYAIHYVQRYALQKDQCMQMYSYHVYFLV